MAILDDIDIQLRNLLNTRAIFPYMTHDLIGHSIFNTAPFYQARGYNIQFQFGEPLNQSRLDELNSICHWINQNYLIRLCSLLEYNEIIPREDQGRLDNSREGFDDIDILRRIRNIFSHTSGRYNSSDPDEIRLYNRIIEQYHLDRSTIINANEYPIPIDKVIIPITEGCKKYIQSIVTMIV